MAQISADQIEARALELFNTRKANLARRDRWAAEEMRFEGTEREFCLGVAGERLQWEAFEANKADAEIAFWAGVSTPAINAMIAAYERDRARPHYTIATHTAIQERDYSELSRMRAEVVRRLKIKIAEDDAATDAAISESAARLADMRAPVMQAAE